MYQAGSIRPAAQPSSDSYMAEMAIIASNLLADSTIPPIHEISVEITHKHPRFLPSILTGSHKISTITVLGLPSPGSLPGRSVGVSGF